MAGRMTKSLRNGKDKPRQPRNMPHLASRLFDTPLLIDERKLDAIVPIFERKLNGEPLNQNLNGDDYRDSGDIDIDIANGIAVIPVIGTLIRRSTGMDAWSGLMSYPEIAENLECALNDARVKGILLQVDSCGGEAPGCFELCDQIFNARSKKPIWAHADVDAMSAAYAILSSCEQCYAAPRGHTASIGVISVHLERSRQNDMMGLTYTVFRAGERKGDFNPYEKLSAEAATKQVTSMDRTRTVFVETVARNRPNVSVQAALDTEGQWYDPEDALQLGLIDGISTFEKTFSDFATSLSVPADQIEAPEEPEALPEIGDDDDDGPGGPPDDDDKATTVDEAAQTGLTGNLIEREIEMATQNGGAGGGNPPNPPAPQTGSVVDFTQPEARAVEIAQLCKMAGFAASAPDFIIAGKSVPEVRAALTDMQAERSEAAVTGGGIDNTQPGKSGGAANGGNGLGGFIQRRTSDEAVASWTPHLKAAQATNPRFALKLANS